MSIAKKNRAQTFSRAVPRGFFLSRFPRLAAILAGFAFLAGDFGAGAAPALVDWPDLGLRLAPGFRVTEYADQNLANDIYAMTLDAKGRVVVTSQGYIKTLEDTDGDGRADQAKVFARTATGGMGLCFDGTTLYFVGDGFFSRYRDADGDGVADGAPERILPLHFMEHGGHAPRKGPDGWWYVIGGNDAGISNAHATMTNSPISWPEAGAILRVNPDTKKCEIIADGLRNPYDFDFNAQGDIFTYDSDVESDFFLPWYTPTRLYDIGYGNHHGWRLNGWKRSWNRPDYYPDTVDILFNVGRGSPTGVVCYRHRRFPDRYRNGLFFCDWTFGKIFFTPLRPSGASYQAAPEVFLEPIGTHGFAPTDLAVAPDGALYVSIGGRKTRGAVYRIEAAAPNAAPTNGISEVAFVLQSVQPLDAWSRARWEPLAKRLGAVPFCQAAINEGLETPERVRAIEVVTELFNGLPEITARKAGASPAPAIRARVAWSLGKAPYRQCGSLLLTLAQDADPMVRRAALDAAMDQIGQVNHNGALGVWLLNFSHADKRVRQAAAWVCTLLPEPKWTLLWSNLRNESLQTQLTGALAGIWRNAVAQLPDIQNIAGAVLAKSNDPGLQLQAVRILQLTLGDYHLNDPSVEVYTAYEPGNPWNEGDPARSNILSLVRAIFPSRDSTLNLETSRLLAMLEDPARETVLKTAEQVTLKSSPTSDFHYLTVLSRLRGRWPDELAGRVADALLNLDTKLAGQEQRPKQNWSLRLVEVISNLLQREPGLGPTLLAHPQFVRPSHLEMVRAFPPQALEEAARLYLNAARGSAGFPWSPALVRLIAILPPAEIRPLLRTHWDKLELREAILEELARPPEAIDRPKFLTGLASGNPVTVGNCLEALMQLARDPTPQNLVPLVELVEKFSHRAEESNSLRAALILLNRQSGQNFGNVYGSGRGLDAGKEAGQWFKANYPALASTGPLSAAEEMKAWQPFLNSAGWERGNVEKGRQIFEARGCQTCHMGANALGPDLVGVTRRLSPEDLLRSIVDPNQEVAPPYRVSLIQTRDGQTYSGIVAFDSADGVILQTAPASTLRLAQSEIVSHTITDHSLMPTGLLKDLGPEGLGDLFAFLKSLSAGESPMAIK